MLTVSYERIPVLLHISPPSLFPLAHLSLSISLSLTVCSQEELPLEWLILKVKGDALVSRFRIHLPDILAALEDAPSEEEADVDATLDRRPETMA